MLYVLNDNFLLSQTAATLGAMTANFFLNNVLTYRDQRIVGIDLLRGLAVFCLSCSCGAFNNILVAHLIYTATGIWWLATGVGILVGAACNYVLSALRSGGVSTSGKIGKSKHLRETPFYRRAAETSVSRSPLTSRGRDEILLGPRPPV